MYNTIQSMEAKSTITEDLLEEILCRLTVKQLLQLRCVNKLWCSVIDKSSFSQKHHDIRYAMLKEEDDVPLFCDKPSIYGLKEDPTQFYLLSKKLENDILCLTPDLRRDSSHYFKTDDDPNEFNSLFCVGLVNGVALLHWNKENVGFWNPATREFKAVPHPRPNQPENVEESIASFIGFGHDSKCNDFKIVRSILWMMRKPDGEWERDTKYEMYSLRANNWKNFEFPWYIRMNTCVTDGYLNGVHYWPANEYEDNSYDYPRRFGLLCYNFSTEVFQIVDPPPPACKDGPQWEWCVGRYKDFLAVIFTDKDEDENMGRFETWIVTKFDDDDPAVPQTWEHLFTIGPIPAYDGLWFSAFLFDGDVVLTVQGGPGASNTVGGHECVIYTPTTRTMKSLGVGLASCLIYAESLFSFSKI